MKKKILHIASIVMLALITLVIIGALMFYLLIVAGLSPSLQETWICTAMTTMSHKYLATSFFSEEKINEVLEKNMVDDSGYESEIITFENNNEDKEEDKNDELDAVPVVAEPVDPYLEEGYRELEDGIYLKEVSGMGWRGQVMLITDPTRVKLVDTKNQYYCGEKVEMMTERVGAVAGINGGGFVDGVDYNSNGGTPMGLIIEDGVLVCPSYADDYYTHSMIGINSEGALILRHVTPKWAMENDIQSSVTALCFLVVNGEGLISTNGGSWGIAPRTAIGQRKTGEYLFLTVDGRQADWSIGCDLIDLETVMLEEDAYNAAMVDGGTSTVMVYQNKIINRPSNGEGRYINNSFVVMPAK